MSLEIEDEHSLGGFTASDVEQVVKVLVSSGSWREPGEPLTLAPDLLWRPDLVSTDGASVLHVHMDTRLRSYVVARLNAARKNGTHVHVALPLSQLYEERVLRVLSSSRASIIVLRSDEAPLPPVELLRLLAQEQIVVSESLRVVLGRDGWDACKEENISAHEKGRRLESLLAFLLSQVRSFRVVETNLRTATEELDLVVQLTSLDLARCWIMPGCPFVLVEAKNWTSKVGQPEISVLHTKMITKRGTVRVGLFVGANGFSRDADLQVLKLSMGPETITLLGPEDLEQWIEQGEDYLEARVRNAMLR